MIVNDVIITIVAVIMIMIIIIIIIIVDFVTSHSDIRHIKILTQVTHAEGIPVLQISVNNINICKKWNHV